MLHRGWGVFLAWVDGTLHVWKEGCRRNYFEGVGEISGGETKERRDRNESSARGIRDAVSAWETRANELFLFLRFRVHL